MQTTSANASVSDQASSAKLIDTHCHLYDKRYDSDREDIISNGDIRGVYGAVVIGCDLDSTHAAVSLAKSSSKLWATAGTHPHEAKNHEPDWASVYQQLAETNQVIAIGEIGLDFYYNSSDPQRQTEVFHELMALAKSLQLPVVIHSRDANTETVDVLKAYAGDVTGIMHTFAGDEAMAKACIDLGYYLSFSGMLTFKNAQNLRDIAQSMPEEYLLIETDSPYLAPVPHRGRRNEPAYVVHVAECLAEIRKTSVDAIIEQTYQNACRAFRTTF